MPKTATKKTASKKSATEKPGAFTEQQINDTFEKLGLSDPRYLEYLNRLSCTAESQQPSTFWYGADSGTSLIKSGIADA